MHRGLHMLEEKSTMVLRLASCHCHQKYEKKRASKNHDNTKHADLKGTQHATAPFRKYQPQQQWTGLRAAHISHAYAHTLQAYEVPTLIKATA